MMNIRKSSAFLLIMLFASMISLVLILHSRNLPTVFAEELATPSSLYLPMVAAAESGATVTPTKTATTTPPAEQKAFFVDVEWKTSRAGIATDAQGGSHLAYAYYEAVGEGVPTSGVYLYCASDCDKDTNWNGVAMGEMVKEIQLALTPQGRPRILYRSATSNNGSDYYYASCDENCTDAAKWTVTLVASDRGMSIVELGVDELPNRYFALDQEGRPRFVYNDRNTWITPDHVGTFYAFCNQGCTEKANWSDVRINQDNGNHSRFEKFLYPSLTFTKAGQPRVVADGTSMQDESFLYYLACDTGCESADGWQRLPLFPRGSGVNVSYDIEVNAADQPRVAFYQGAMLEGKGDRLSYAWCNGACLDATSWQRTELGLAVLEGQDPDLELDAAGRPHIAYALYNGGGLGYAQCEAHCEEPGAQWKVKVVETRNDLEAAWPVAFPPHCDGGLWDGLTPTLSLDKRGTPRIAYDAVYHARCWYIPETGEWKPWPNFSLIKRAVRVVLMPASAGGTPEITATPTGSATATSTATATATATATPTATQQPPARLGAGAFMDTQWSTGSSSIAVDANNGRHVAYVYHEPMFEPDPNGDANPTAAIYRYCQANCDNLANWQGVALGEAVSEVQIGLTPAGQPRLLLLARAEESWGHADRYLFAECDQKCTDRAQWRIGPVVTTPNDMSWHWDDDPGDVSGFNREYQARRYFALDPMGRPRFIYYHYNEEVDLNGVGAYYASCDANCTVAGNWTHTRITKTTDWSGEPEWEILERAALTFTPDGQPRLLAAFLPNGILRFPGLYYFACDEHCDSGENWLNALVGESGDENGQWDIAVDGAGRPRVILSGYVASRGYVLRYVWCDETCLDMFSWQRTELPGEGEHPDLALNAQGQPRIVVKNVDYDATGNNPSDTLYYLSCNANCQSADGQWQRTSVENGDNLAAEWLGTVPPPCVGGEWHIIFPSLVLNAGGNPHVAYDTNYIAKCEYDPASGAWTPGGEYSYNTPWRAVRAVHFP